MAAKLIFLAACVSVSLAQYAVPSAYYKPAPAAVYSAPAPAYVAPAPAYASYAAAPAPVYPAYRPYAAAAPVEPAYPPIPYSYEYAVNDYHTGDVKSQAESSDGKNVKGYYSLLESDGTKRVVEYTADDYGFNAVVKKEGTPVYAPAPAPVAYAAAPAPVAYAAAPAAVAYAPAPVYRTAAPVYRPIAAAYKPAY